MVSSLRSAVQNGRLLLELNVTSRTQDQGESDTGWSVKSAKRGESTWRDGVAKTNFKLGAPCVGIMGSMAGSGELLFPCAKLGGRYGVRSTYALAVPAECSIEMGSCETSKGCARNEEPALAKENPTHSGCKSRVKQTVLLLDSRQMAP